MHREGGYLVLRSVIEVIKEDAPQAAPLIPVLAVEVLVCPLLEPRVVRRVMLVAHALHEHNPFQTKVTKLNIADYCKKMSHWQCYDLALLQQAAYTILVHKYYISNPAEVHIYA